MGRPLYGDVEGKYQADLQMSFLIIAAVCALLILIPKPFILWVKNLNNARAPAPAGYSAQHDDPGVQEKLLGDNEGEEVSILN